MTTTSITEPGLLLCGQAPAPVTCGRELTIGGGKIYPGMNFTLDSAALNTAGRAAIVSQYADLVDEICQRAVAWAVRLQWLASKETYCCEPSKQ